MGIIHHANYMKWMEEARIAFMEEIGFGYKKME
jgi:acyl-CoA thioester hydrolase